MSRTVPTGARSEWPYEPERGQGSDGERNVAGTGDDDRRGDHSGQSYGPSGRGDQGAAAPQNVQGPQGPQSPQGPQGPQGQQGQQGAPGGQAPQGPQGPQGQQGAPGGQAPQGYNPAG